MAIVIVLILLLASAAVVVVAFLDHRDVLPVMHDIRDLGF